MHLVVHRSGAQPAKDYEGVGEIPHRTVPLPKARVLLHAQQKVQHQEGTCTRCGDLLITFTSRFVGCSRHQSAEEVEVQIQEQQHIPKAHTCRSSHGSRRASLLIQIIIRYMSPHPFCVDLRPGHGVGVKAVHSLARLLPLTAKEVDAVLPHSSERVPKQAGWICGGLLWAHPCSLPCKRHSSFKDCSRITLPTKYHHWPCHAALEPLLIGESSVKWGRLG